MATDVEFYPVLPAHLVHSLVHHQSWKCEGSMSYNPKKFYIHAFIYVPVSDKSWKNIGLLSRPSLSAIIINLLAMCGTEEVADMMKRVGR